MRLLQHIYGRVTKGIELPGPGFQLAASSASLRSDPVLVENLNRFSFAKRWEGLGPAERYSFFRPAPGWLAFGCARLAKDLSGAVGFFAHNFVCSETDFVASGFSPPALIRALQFLGSESELPTCRDLEHFMPPDHPMPEPRPRWRAAAEELASIYLTESALVVPLVVVDPAQTWDLLDEVFSLLPRIEAARLSFSTLFVDAIAFVDGYRLTLVPSRDAVPLDSSSIFRVAEAEPAHPLNIARGTAPLVVFAHAAPQASGTLCRLVDLLRRRPDNSEVESLIAQLLPQGRVFRAALESLDAPALALYGWLTSHPEWLPAWSQAGNGLNHTSICDAVRDDPGQRLGGALDGARDCGDSVLITRLYEEAAHRLAQGLWPAFVARAVLDSHRRTGFFQVVDDPRRIDDATLVSLADRLDGLPGYNGEAHQIAIRRLLGGFAGEGRNSNIEQWVVRLAREREEASWMAIAGLLTWRDASSWRRPSVRLAAYSSLREPLYRGLIAALWRTDISGREFAAIAFHPDHHHAFFDFCVKTLRSASPEVVADLLRGIVELGDATPSDHARLAEAVTSHGEAFPIAQAYLKLLLRNTPPASEAVERLRAVPKPRPKPFWD